MNSSILAILLTAVCLFILNFIFSLLGTKELKFAYQIILALTTTFAIYLCLHGRAALIGACANIVYLIFKELKLSKYFLLKAAVLLILAVVVVFFSLKKDSSYGRILIYKVVFTQLKPNDYILGLGIGKFKARYNKLQAAYFEHHDRNSKEALLAGNGYYLFNDWLQFALEIGALTVLLICCFIVSFFKIFNWQPKKKSVLFAANGALVNISTAALFSYPLQVPAILIFFITCLFIHIYCSYSIKAAYNYKYFRGFLYTLTVSLAIISVCYCLLVYQYKSKSKLAFELNRDGFKDEAEVIFKKLLNYPIADYNTYYNYAYLLYFKNELNNSLHQINKSLDLAYSAEGVKLKADVLFGLNKASEAEFFYKQAVYITPNRMFPKFNLLQFYIKTKQLNNAKFWANDILNMPIKKSSETTNNILQMTRKILNEIKEKSSFKLEKHNSKSLE